MNEYFEKTKNFWTSFVFIMPLVIGYHVGLYLTKSHVANAAQGLLGRLLTAFEKTFRVSPATGQLILGIAVLIVVVIAVIKMEHRRDLRFSLFGTVLLESILYAVVLGFIASFLSRFVSEVFLGSTATSIVLSLGAGVYEEIVFRLILLGGLYWLLVKAFDVRPTLSVVISIVISSLVFSLFHYVGPTESFAANTFIFRAAAGGVLGVIYVYRGLAVVAYTHAFYDIFIVIHPLLFGRPGGGQQATIEGLFPYWIG